MINSKNSPEYKSRMGEYIDNIEDLFGVVIHNNSWDFIKVFDERYILFIYIDVVGGVTSSMKIYRGVIELSELTYEPTCFPPKGILEKAKLLIQLDML